MLNLSTKQILNLNGCGPPKLWITEKAEKLQYTFYEAFQHKLNFRTCYKTNLNFPPKFLSFKINSKILNGFFSELILSLCKKIKENRNFFSFFISFRKKGKKNVFFCSI